LPKQIGVAERQYGFLKKIAITVLSWRFCAAKSQWQTGSGGLIYRLLLNENVYQ
jgi:hypothetical protein